MPVEFRTITRAEEKNWVNLREALAAERIATRRGEAVDPSAQTVLLQARANATVSAAISNLNLYLSAITTAWHNAIRGEPNP